MVIVDGSLEDGLDSIPPYASPNPSPARGVYGKLTLDFYLHNLVRST